jgi:transcription antitermination factor NusG
LYAIADVRRISREQLPEGIAHGTLSGRSVRRGRIAGMCNDVSCHWYALQVRPNQERSVASKLRELGVEEYLPYHIQPLRTVGKYVQKESLLFPGYVFCNLNLDVGPKLYYVTGILRILGYGKHPSPIDDAEMQAVRSLAASSLFIESHPYLYPGVRVDVVAGPLAGISGTLLRSSNSNFVVSLPLLQRSLAVVIPPEWMMPHVSTTWPQAASQV